ncbi:phenylacetate--CoA ligase family protein [Haladaptatus sp. ZSTT2]|uniref:phenylacetate--CoA ligase family protein n=1 Tax=Haladaptatus sp. ZSTT2 TaxID=3120515 RepID=UPI00300EAF5D
MADYPHRLHRAVDFDRIETEYPPPEEFLADDGFFYASREEIRERKEQRLKWKVEQAWEIPFYRRRWEAAGITPDDINGLDDINKIPIYTIEDIRKSIDDHPPYGDYQGAALHNPDDAPLRMFMSGGTTGAPRPQIFTADERVIQALSIARAMYMHGIRPGDVALNTWAFSTHNGAWIVDYGFYHWLGVTDITTSTGTVTPSTEQLEHARRWDVDTIYAFPSYLLRLAEVAEQQGYDPKTDFNLKTISTYGPQNERDLVEEAWGVPVYNNYAFHEVNTISASCAERDGMHIFEDLFHIQIVDSETGEEVEPGETGEIVVTELYKTGAPQVRYNIKDLSAMVETPCACGSKMHRLTDFLGRGDNMVKVRGINVWPEAVGQVLTDHDRVSAEYFIFADADDNRNTTLTALVEHKPGDSSTIPELEAELEAMLNAAFDVSIAVEVKAPGELASLTKIGQKTKIDRFEDRR